MQIAESVRLGQDVKIFHPTIVSGITMSVSALVALGAVVIRSVSDYAI